MLHFNGSARHSPVKEDMHHQACGNGKGFQFGRGVICLPYNFTSLCRRWAACHHHPSFFLFFWCTLFISSGMRKENSVPCRPCRGHRSLIKRARNTAVQTQSATVFTEPLQYVATSLCPGLSPPEAALIGSLGRHSYRATRGAISLGTLDKL